MVSPTTARKLTIPNIGADGKNPRLLVVSVGNTNTRFGWFEGASLAHLEAIATHDLIGDPPEVPDEWPVALVSVVPEARRRLQDAWGERVRILNAETSRLEIRYDPPESLGADRLANALAMKARGLMPAIAVDCGTATTFTLLDAQGRLVGGAIAPGLGTAARALIAHTAQLPAIPYRRRAEPWGSDTVASLQLGIVEGHLGMIRHLVERFRWGLAADAPVILCGGWSELLAEGLRDARCEPLLTLEGGRVFGHLR